MPRFNKDAICPGTFLVGGSYPIEDPRRARIAKGKFLTSMAVVRRPLPDATSYQKQIVAGIVEIANDCGASAMIW